MNVFGIQIYETVIQEAVERMDLHLGFTYLDLQSALSWVGVPEKAVPRCADRTLQRLRKQGVIAFDGKVWKAVEK